MLSDLRPIIEYKNANTALNIPIRPYSDVVNALVRIGNKRNGIMETKMLEMK